MKPKIGIPLPTSADPVYNGKCWPQYAAAVRQAGGEPVSLPLRSFSEMRQVAAACSGFVLPGSPSDVNPELYGHPFEPGTAPADTLREECDRFLLESIAASGVPVLAICFGMQVLNVLRGGTLVQDLRPVPVNHGAGAQVGVAHSVLIAHRSLLGGLLSATEAPIEGQFRRLPVNSSHHQAIAIPGDGFTVVARSAEDGVVEAIEGQFGGTVVGVQWHPERTIETSAASRAVFLWIVSAALDLLEGDGGGSSYAGAF